MASTTPPVNHSMAGRDERGENGSGKGRKGEGEAREEGRRT